MKQTSLLRRQLFKTAKPTCLRRMPLFYRLSVDGNSGRNLAAIAVTATAAAAAAYRIRTRITDGWCLPHSAYGVHSQLMSVQRRLVRTQVNLSRLYDAQKTYLCRIHFARSQERLASQLKWESNSDCLPLFARLPSFAIPAFTISTQLPSFPSFWPLPSLFSLLWDLGERCCIRCWNGCISNVSA